MNLVGQHYFINTYLDLEALLKVVQESSPSTMPRPALCFSPKTCLNETDMSKLIEIKNLSKWCQEVSAW